MNTIDSVQDNSSNEISNEEKVFTESLIEIENKIPDCYAPILNQEGVSKPNFKKFTIFNQKLGKVMNELRLTPQERLVIYVMTELVEYGTNSLKPLSDDYSLRKKSDLLSVNKDSIKKITDRLFEIGVFLSIKVYTNEEKKYWVLNPCICWRGSKAPNDILIHFKDCTITRLLMN